MNTAVPQNPGGDLVQDEQQLAPDHSRLHFQVTRHNGKVRVAPTVHLDSIAPRRRKKPIFVQGCPLPIYPTRWTRKATRRTYVGYVIAWRDAAGRKREKHSDLEKAKGRVQQIWTNVINGQAAQNQFSEQDRANWLACQHKALEIGRDPVVLISERVQFEQARPPGVTDDELLKSWRRHHPAGIEERNIPKIVVEFLDKRILSTKYRRNLSKMLERFAERFDCPFGILQQRDIEDWLDSLKVGLRTRHNHRAAAENLANFAKTRGYLDKDWELLDCPSPGDGRISDPEPPVASVDLYTPDDLVKLLTRAGKTKAGRKLVPLIVITAFCGVRHGEMNEEKIGALDWSNFDWEGKCIYVDADAAKQTDRTEGDDRWVDMPANLIAWLTPYRRPDGKLCSLENTSNALCRLRKKAGITGRRKNALRKSFITYKLALGGNIETVAGQAGNSPGVIRKSYRAAKHTRLRDAATRWFKIMPPDDPLFKWAEEKAKRA